MEEEGITRRRSEGRKLKVERGAKCTRGRCGEEEGTRLVHTNAGGSWEQTRI